MFSFAKWWARLGAVVAAATVALLVPGAAWASTGSGALALDAARRRPRVGGLLGGLCCLFVVGIVVIALLFVMRGRRGRR